ncbi:MAG: hypothetical protein V3U83_05070 [Acidobacteriota bacterium]
MKLSRRRFSHYILGAPIAAAATTGMLGTLLVDGRAIAAEGSATAPKPSPLAKLLSGENPDLSRDERQAIRRDVAQLEGALKEIRDFPLANNVPPAFGFQAMKSKRPRGSRR